jgi:hypothetical protein
VFSAIVACIVLAIWLSSVNFTYGWGGYYAGFIWPLFVAFLWMWIAVFLCETRNEVGLLIYAILQGLWTCYMIWNCIQYLTLIAYFNALGLSGGVWFVMFAVYVPSIFFSAAVTFWIFKGYQHAQANRGQPAQQRQPDKTGDTEAPPQHTNDQTA